MALGLHGNRTLIAGLLRAQGFLPGYNGEAFRFVHETSAGDFVVDLLVAPGASRANLPIVEPGIPTLAAPGLAYALLRGAAPLQLVIGGQTQRAFKLRTTQLDAAFVLKAALVATGVRRLGRDDLVRLLRIRDLLGTPNTAIVLASAAGVQLPSDAPSNVIGIEPADVYR